MKKFLSLFLAVLISLSMLTVSALAKSGGGNKSAGAPGQQQVGGKSDKGNNGKGNGKGNTAGSEKPGKSGQKNQNGNKNDDSQKNQNKNGAENGRKNGQENPQFFRQGNPQNVAAITDAIGQLTDSEAAAKLNVLLTAYKEAKPGLDAQDAWKALLAALTEAGVDVETLQPVRRWRYEQQGKPIDVDAITTEIGKLTDTDTAAKLTALLTAYKEAEVGKDVQKALTALLDALTAAGIDVASFQPPMENGEPDEEKPIDVDAIGEAIGKLTDSTVASQLTTLLTAYKDAVSAGETAAQTALTALLDALKAAGITEGVE